MANADHPCYVAPSDEPVDLGKCTDCHKQIAGTTWVIWRDVDGVVTPVGLCAGCAGRLSMWSPAYPLPPKNQSKNVQLPASPNERPLGGYKYPES